MTLIRQIFQGFCMAMADSVPGVSGGTIAFLMGFYEKFITSLNNLTNKDGKKRMDGLRFLAKLGIGWVVGMALAVSVLAVVFDKYIYAVSSLFLGFIVVAIVTMFLGNKSILKFKLSNMITLAAGLVLVVGVTLLNGANDTAIDLAKLNLGNIVYIFIAAMIAISAMVLPGISGSTLLLVFGLYIPVITAVKNLLHFDFSGLPALIVFGLGVLTGIIAFVRWIKLALEKFPTQTMYAIIGLMLGSLFSITMGPTTLEVPQPAMSISTFQPIFFAIGALLVLGLELYKRGQDASEKKAAKIETE